MATPPPALSQAQIDQAMEIARKEAPVVFKAPKLKIRSIRSHSPRLPLWFDLKDEKGYDRRVFVVDGHVVVGQNLAHLMGFLKGIHFLARKELTTQELLSAALYLCPPPDGFDSFPNGNEHPPDVDAKQVGLHYGENGATLVLYQEVEAPPLSGPPGMMMPSGGRTLPTWMRATLSIDANYRASWKVERRPPGAKDFAP